MKKISLIIAAACVLVAAVSCNNTPKKNANKASEQTECSECAKHNACPEEKASCCQETKACENANAQCGEQKACCKKAEGQCCKKSEGQCCKKQAAEQKADCCK